MSPSLRWLPVVAGLLMIVRVVPADEAPLPPDTAQIKGTLAALKDESPQVKVKAINELRDWLEPAGKSHPELAAAAETELVKLVSDHDPDVRRTVLKTLEGRTELPADAVTTLIGLLGDNANGIRQAAAETLAAQKKLTTTALNRLVELLGHNDPEIQEAAAQAISGEKRLSEANLKQLVGMMGSNDPDVRHAAAVALQGKNALPEAARNALAGLLTDDAAYVCRSAAEALGAQKELPPPVIRQLLELLKHKDDTVRRASAKALGRLEKLDETTVDALVDLLETNVKARQSAAVVLGRRKRLPAGGLDRLLTMLKGDGSTVSNAALVALGGQKELSREIVDHLVELLKTKPTMSRSAAEVLSGQKELREESLNRVAELLQNRDFDVRSNAAKALKSQKTLPKRVVEKLLDMLEVEEPEVRRAAIETLKTQKELPTDTMPRFLEIMGHKVPYIRRGAAESLEGQRELPPKVVDRLCEMLKDHEEEVRYDAEKTLGGQKRLPEESLNTLVEMLGNEAVWMRRTATQSLKGVKTLPETALPFLLKQLETGNDVDAVEELLLRTRPASIIVFLEMPYENTALTAEARWLAHYWGGGDPENEALCRLLGRPMIQAKTPGTQEEKRTHLKTLGKAFDETRSPRLQEDAALWAGHIFSSAGVDWKKEDLPEVEKWIDRVENHTTDERLRAHLPEMKRVQDRLNDRYLELKSIAVALLCGCLALLLLRWIPAEWHRAKAWVPMLTAVGGTVSNSVWAWLGQWALSPPWMMGTLAVFTLLVLGWGLHSPPFLRDLAKVAPFNFFVLALAHSLPWTRRRLYVEVRADTATKAEQAGETPSANAEDPLYYPLPARDRSRRDGPNAVLTQPVEEIVSRLIRPVGTRGHVLVMGSGGLGKTTLLNKVVRRLLEEFDNDPTGRPLPVFLAAEGDSIGDRLKKGLKKALIAPELLSDYVKRGWFVLVADNIDLLGQGDKEIAAFHENHHSRCPLLLCGREHEEIKRAVRDTPNALVVEPSLLDDATLDGFIDHCIKHIGGKPLSKELKTACRGAHGYIPLLVRLAVTLPSDSAAVSRADIFREYLFRQCRCEKENETDLLKGVARLALKTHWTTGKREFAYDKTDEIQKRLRETGVLVPFGQTGVKFFHDSVLTYFTAEGLLLEELNDYRDLPRPESLPHTPWDRSRVLFWTAGRAEFVALQSDGVSELLDVFLTLFVARGQDAAQRTELLSEIRKQLREELLDIEERFRPFKKSVPHNLGDPATLLALIPDGVARDQLPQEGAATLIPAAAEACFLADERAGNVALLKKMYGNLARHVFDRVLESDRRAEKRNAGDGGAHLTLAKGA